MLPTVFGILYRKKLAFCGTCSAHETILPWRPRYAGHRGAELALGNLLPLSALELPHSHAFVVAATSQDILVFGMCPSHRPGRALMRLKESACRYLLVGIGIIIDVAHLDKAITVTGSEQ